MNCPKCNNEMRMMVQVTVSAPSSLESNFSKSNLRKPEVHIMGVNWEMADFFCEAENCRTNIPGHRNYVQKLKEEVTRLKEKYEPNN